MIRIPIAAALGFSLLFASGGAGFAQDFLKGASAYLKGEYATAFREFQPLAEQGNRGAQGFLGMLYYSGDGVTQDYKEAARWHRLAAEQGSSTSQSSLGLMYANGEGVTQDYKEAARWYRLSAEQGWATAQANLGVLYSNGTGVIQDNVYAHMWFNIAASNGQKEAAKFRDIAAGNMTEEDISKAQGLARACVAKKYKGC